jgi:hypothetical protein
MMAQRVVLSVLSISKRDVEIRQMISAAGSFGSEFRRFKGVEISAGMMECFLNLCSL